MREIKEDRKDKREKGVNKDRNPETCSDYKRHVIQKKKECTTLMLKQRM